MQTEPANFSELKIISAVFGLIQWQAIRTRSLKPERYLCSRHPQLATKFPKTNICASHKSGGRSRFRPKAHFSYVLAERLRSLLLEGHFDFPTGKGWPRSKKRVERSLVFILIHQGPIAPQTSDSRLRQLQRAGPSLSVQIRHLTQAGLIKAGKK